MGRSQSRTSLLPVCRKRMRLRAKTTEADSHDTKGYGHCTTHWHPRSSGHRRGIGYELLLQLYAYGVPVMRAQPALRNEWSWRSNYRSSSMCLMAIAIGDEHQAMRKSSSSASTQLSLFNARAVQSHRQTIEDAETESIEHPVHSRLP